MSHAQFKSSGWTCGYLRWHTDRKSIHKWPQHGANTHFNYFSGIWDWILTDFECLGLGWVKHSTNQLFGPEATSDCTETGNPSTNGLSVGQNSFLTTISLGIWGWILTDFECLGLWWVKHSSNQLFGPQAMSDHTQTWNPSTNGLSVGQKSFLPTIFFGNLRSDFNGFWMPGLEMSQAQRESIVWPWGYPRLHTDLKSTHKWPQQG